MMKKGILFVILMFVSVLYSVSQERGKTALEFTVNPAALFDGSAGSLFYMPYFKVRFFQLEDFAIRIGISSDFDSRTNHPFNSADNIEKNSSFLISLNPGVEKHFASGNFSPYVGAGLDFAWKTSKGKYTVGSTNITTRNVWTDGSNAGYFSIGLEGYLGCDYYIASKFFLGFEFSPGFSLHRNLEQERNTSGTSVTTPSSTSTSFSLYSYSGLRIGVRF